MRQAGIIAAAGIVSLEKMVNRLDEDHHHAKQLADGLAIIPGISLDPGTPYTNLLFLNLVDDISIDAAQVGARLKELGVLVGIVEKRRFRLATHYWVNEESVQRAIDAFRDVLSNV
jgi:threonine aldolase